MTNDIKTGAGHFIAFLTYISDSVLFIDMHSYKEYTNSGIFIRDGIEERLHQ
jgi:hypothetical protein